MKYKKYKEMIYINNILTRFKHVIFLIDLLTLITM